MVFMASGMASTFVDAGTCCEDLSPFGAGLLFGVGLWLSGMANPRKVLDFLDIAGNWDPSLLRRDGRRGRRHRWLSFRQLIELKQIDFRAQERRRCRSIVGAAIFGIGWGIGGYCPGPAITALVQL